jgi:hypothetical protein
LAYRARCLQYKRYSEMAISGSLYFFAFSWLGMCSSMRTVIIL